MNNVVVFNNRSQDYFSTSIAHREYPMAGKPATLEWTDPWMCSVLLCYVESTTVYTLSKAQHFVTQFAIRCEVFFPTSGRSEHVTKNCFT